MKREIQILLKYLPIFVAPVLLKVFENVHENQASIIYLRTIRVLVLVNVVTGKNHEAIDLMNHIKLILQAKRMTLSLGPHYVTCSRALSVLS